MIFGYITYLYEGEELGVAAKSIYQHSDVLGCLLLSPSNSSVPISDTSSSDEDVSKKIFLLNIPKKLLLSHLDSKSILFGFPSLFQFSSQL